MKFASKKFILLALFIGAFLKANAQLSKQGVTFQGVDDTDMGYLRQLGLVAFFDASQGVMTNSSGRVVTWNDISGNGYKFVNYGGTGPTFDPAHSTNAFPALVFQATRPMFCHDLAQFFTGKKPVTLMSLSIGQVSGSQAAIAAGYTSAISSGASHMTIRKSSSPPTSVGLYMGVDTNTGADFSVGGGGTTSNVFSYTGYYINTNETARSCNNLTFSGIQTIPGGTLTLNTFTIGARSGTNANLQSGWTGGISQLLIFSNVMTATQFTNTVKELNRKRKVF